jgi:hypothetical protein
MRNKFLAELLEACSHFAPPKKAELLRCSIAAASAATHYRRLRSLQQQSFHYRSSISSAL